MTCSMFPVSSYSPYLLDALDLRMHTCTCQIGQCIEDGVLQREKLKIVYIAPMKALAAELVTKFSRSLAPLGLQVSWSDGLW